MSRVERAKDKTPSSMPFILLPLAFAFVTVSVYHDPAVKMDWQLEQELQIAAQENPGESGGDWMDTAIKYGGWAVKVKKIAVIAMALR